MECALVDIFAGGTIAARHQLRATRCSVPVHDGVIFHATTRLRGAMSPDAPLFDARLRE